MDLRGFTAFTDSAEPEEVEAVLRDYQAAMGSTVTEFEGTLDRFAGDGILVFFNDPLPIAEPGRRAATMALAMQERFAPLRERWVKFGYELALGIGIAQSGSRRAPRLKKKRGRDMSGGLRRLYLRAIAG